MRGSGAQGTESERGQATVELLGVLPAALLVALAAWQLVLAGQSVWLTARAAHSAARAQAVGKDPERAARTAIPSPLRRGLRVRAAPDGTVAVRLGFRSPLAGDHVVRFSSRARLEGR